jgi:hypothetical protein
MPARRRASESRREAIARAPAIVHVRIPAGSPARERISPRTRDRAAPAILAQPGSRNQASSRIRRMRHLPSTSLAISPLTRKAASARVTPSRLTGPPTLDMGSRADHRIGLQAKVHSPPGACCRSAARIGVAIFEPGPSRNPARPLPTTAHGRLARFAITTAHVRIGVAPTAIRNGGHGMALVGTFWSHRRSVVRTRGRHRGGGRSCGLGR